MSYSGEWIFTLNIHNKTDADLDLGNHRLSWGHWYGKQKDGTIPVKVSANGNMTVEAFSIRASAGTATGYEAYCTWTSKYGNIMLNVNVPYSADNKVSLQWDDRYVITGWEEIGKRGHNFIRNIEVSAL